jgi:hypothetical protein
MTQSDNLKVINLFAGPGAGKSTTMASIFCSMKRRGMNVEMCPEWVKGASWEERKQTFTDQGYILGKQNYLLHRLRGKVVCAITDSPLLLSPVYAKFYEGQHPYSNVDWNTHAKSIFNTYDNFNVFIHRTKPYNPSGRNQNNALALKLDRMIFDYLDAEKLPFFNVSDEAGIEDLIIDEWLHYGQE